MTEFQDQLAQRVAIKRIYWLMQLLSPGTKLPSSIAIYKGSNNDSSTPSFYTLMFISGSLWNWLYFLTKVQLSPCRRQNSHHQLQTSMPTVLDSKEKESFSSVANMEKFRDGIQLAENHWTPLITWSVRHHQSTWKGKGMPQEVVITSLIPTCI